MKEKISITLRELERGDLLQLNKWRNDKEIIDLLGNNFLFINQSVDEEWFQNYLQTRDKNVRLAITVADTEEYIGNVNLLNIHQINLSAELSILIGNKDYQNKGAGPQAMQHMLEHGFNNLNLNRIYLTVLKDNEYAIKTYEKAGFVPEGVQRQAIFKNVRFYDMVMMGILREEFQVL